MGDAEKKVEDVIKRGRKEVIQIQQDNGIDIVTEGQLSWDDLLVFPTTRMEGVEMGGIVRFYDNNRFYREPSIVNELNRTQPLTAHQYRSARHVADTSVKAVMPGPYSLARLSKNEYYNNETDYYDAFAETVNQELQALDDGGAELIQLDEPSLTGVNDEGIDIEAAIRSISHATEGVSASVIVTTYFGDITEAYPELLNVVDGIALDFVSGEQNLQAVEEHGSPPRLGIGCMNARNTRLEPIEELVETVDEVLDNGSPDQVYLGPNCGLDFLPWTVMKDKVKRLGRTVREVN